MNETQPLSLRETAKGIAIRAGVLSAAALIGGAWLFGLVAKAASGFVKLTAGAILLAAAGGVITWEVKKAQRRLSA